jgi:Leucine-rich repeat (LRR) protein
MQESLIKNAVTFLKNPKIVGADKEKVLKFLKNKGLSDDDIKEAYRRVNEPTETPSLDLDLPAQPVSAPKLPILYSKASSFINLSFSSLSALPAPEAFSSAKTIIASFNTISELPVSIGTLNDLQHLNLMSNKITSQGLPDRFFTLFNLIDLNLSRNSLTSLERFGRLSSLQKLNVSENSIEEIPDDFILLQELRFFWVQNNRISKVPECLMKLSNLKMFVIVT